MKGEAGSNFLLYFLSESALTVGEWGLVETFHHRKSVKEIFAKDIEDMKFCDLNQGTSPSPAPSPPPPLSPKKNNTAYIHHTNHSTKISFLHTTQFQAKKTPKRTTVTLKHKSPPQITKSSD